MTTSFIQLNADEGGRLAALHRYSILDEPADDELEAVVRVTAMIADVPKATLNLLDENRQCQLTTVGFAGDNLPRDESMCDVEFRTGHVVHVPDATKNPLYANNPWVNGQLGNVRFYASAPLLTPEGWALGTLCVFDEQVRTLTQQQLDRMRDLAEVVVALFERRRQARLNAELALESERREQFTETLLETIDVGIVVADPYGRVTLLNRTAREWHGLDADTHVKPGDLAAVYGLYEPDGVTLLTRDRVPLLSALHADVDNQEIVVRSREKGDLQLTVTGRPLVDDDGALLGSVIAMKDVTPDRAYRNKLEQAHAALEDANGELQRSNEELEQFAGAVSHDLVRPMAAAHGYLELLTGGYGPGLDRQAGKWLESAVRAVERMQQLVEALLHYARAGQAPYQPIPVSLPDVLTHVVADLRTAIADSGAEVTWPADMPAVIGDPTLLRQLLQNLVDNAIKYREPTRACRIVISANCRDGACRITIADNGIGIPAEHRARVFDMFTQVDPAARKGHGIGLSTCQRIVDRHHGSIEIGDTPGGGTTLDLRLPIHNPTC